MANGNGDERQQAAWERVEAKLDRLADRVDGVDARLGALEKRVGAVEDTQLHHAESLRRLTALVEALVRQGERFAGELAASRREMDTGFLAIDASFREMDARFDRLRQDIIGGYADVAHRDLLAVQTLNEEKLTELERRVRALEEARS